MAFLALMPLAPASAGEPAPTGGDGDFICSTYDTDEMTCSWTADFRPFQLVSDFSGELKVYDETEDRWKMTFTSPGRGLRLWGAITTVGHRYTATLTGEGWFSIIESPYPPTV